MVIGNYGSGPYAVRTEVGGYFGAAFRTSRAEDGPLGGTCPPVRRKTLANRALRAAMANAG